MKKFLNTIWFFILFAFACSSGQPNPEYLEEIDSWRTERISNLKAPDGWLSLAGLYTLQEGENSFGSGKWNHLVFPLSAPDTIGSFFLLGDSVTMKIAAAQKVSVDDQFYSDTILTIFNDTSSAIVNRKSLTWFVIERGGRFLVRLRDADNPAIQHLGTIEHYRVDPQWKIPATFEAYDTRTEVKMRNVLDMEISMETEGLLRFEVGGTPQELTVLDGGAEDWFIIFADLTSGETTYPGGRYMYVPKADAEGKTVLDFNKAYNPPCAFTDYATCLLPPAENRLEVAITAGEKNYGEH